MPGIFIAIEGTDGSGKGTQFELLVKHLRSQGKQVVTMDFPQYGQKSAGPVEEYLNGKYGGVKDVSAYVASLFYAIDRFDASFKIRAALKQGKIVLSNRYVLSNAAHQGSKIKNPAAQRKFIKWIKNLEYHIINIPQPDLNILLHMPADHAFKLILKKQQRAYLAGKKRDIHEANKKHLRDTEKVYLALARQDSKIKTIKCAHGKTILPIQTITQEIIKLTNKII